MSFNVNMLIESSDNDGDEGDCSDNDGDEDDIGDDPGIFLVKKENFTPTFWPS